MGAAQVVAPSPLVGRDEEVAELVGVAEDASRGRAGALMIFGEAGVGKTALVRQACSRLPHAAVLWAACLPLTAFAVPLLPLTSAFRDRPDAPPASPVDVDDWVSAACRQQPLVLVVDDLQWADQSSLDVLMYLLAGPSSRRLAVMATVRTGEAPPAVRRWLADVRRLPGVRERRLGPLDRVMTAEQIAALLGAPPHSALVDEVFARTRGNAYLTSLLVRGVSPDATTLPAGLPADLRAAVTRSWQGLSARARELTRLVAVAGRPSSTELLDEVASPDDDVLPPLREAVGAGVLEVSGKGRYWFTHPLLAEELAAGLLPEERRAYHAAFAQALVARTPSVPDRDVERVIAVADHFHGAGQHEHAYRWTLRAAEASEQAGGAAEALRLLRRALDLRELVAEAGASRIELLQRLRSAAQRTGAQEEELRAVEDLLSGIDKERQPLFAAELLVRRMQLKLSTGREFAALDDVREAVRLAAGHPASAEYALSMAELAHAELWHEVATGPAHAEEAVRLSRTCGSPKALAYALTADVMRQVLTGGTGDGTSEAEEACDAAATAGDFWALLHATLWAGNIIDTWSSRDVIELGRRSRERMVALGAPHVYVGKLSADEASGLLELGDWRACTERLGAALGSSPGPMGDVHARLTAALLSCRQGRQAEADAHLARAEEVFDEHSGFLAFPFAAVRAELALAAGDTKRVVAVTLAAIDRQGVAPTYAERLLPLAARAIADDAQALRDAGEDPGPAVEQLNGLRRRFPEVIVDGALQPTYRAQVGAHQACYDSEVHRAGHDAVAAQAWTRAAQACARAGLLWDEAYARWRAAEALLAGGSSRRVGAAMLRQANELAADLRARPLTAQIHALARSARVPLSAATPVGESADAGPLPGLTPREREILSYVVAGRTYGEIARDLVISEKTVSVHISNMLRKTGTTSRVELSQLAGRRRTPPD